MSRSRYEGHISQNHQGKAESVPISGFTSGVESPALKNSPLALGSQSIALD